METVNHECYVSLEVAKLLKQAGFDWECRGYYDRQILRFNFIWEHNGKGTSTQCSAPTLSVAQKWLREKNLLLYICPLHSNKKWLWRYWFINCINKEDTTQIYSTEKYNTYEQAQEAGIKRCLEEDSITDKCSEE